MAFWDYANPTRFLKLVQVLLPWLIGLCVVTFAIGLYMNDPQLGKMPFDFAFWVRMHSSCMYFVLELVNDGAAALRQITDELKANPEVIEIDLVAGRFDLVVMLVAKRFARSAARKMDGRSKKATLRARMAARSSPIAT